MMTMFNVLSAQGQLEWSVSVQMPVAAGLAGPVTGVSGGELLLAGGSNFSGGMPWEGGVKQYYDSVYVLEDKTYRWTCAGRLEEPVAYAACVSTPNGLVYAGGECASGLSRKVYRLCWDGAGRGMRIVRLADLPFAVSNAAGAWLNGRIFVVGGECAMGGNCSAGVSDRCWSLGEGEKAWREEASLPKPVSHTVLVADSVHGVLYVASGRKRNAGGVSDLSAAVYRFAGGRWKACADLPHAMSAGTGVLLGNGDVLLFGGDPGTTFSRVEALIAAIGVEADSVRKAGLVAEKTDLQRWHPGFSREIWRYESTTDRWVSAGELTFPSPVTTTAFYWKGRIVIPGGEIRAGVRTAQILMGTIKSFK